jgi:hypothetical protein
MIADVYRFSKKYYRLLDLSRWEVNVKFAGSEPVPVASLRSDDSNDQTVMPADNETKERGAKCEVEWEYWRAEIVFYLDYLESQGRQDDIEQYVCHEMWHIVLWPLALMANDLTDNEFTELISRVDERLTEDIATLDFWTRLK